MIKSVYQTIYTVYADKTVHRNIEIEVTHLLKGQQRLLQIMIFKTEQNYVEEQLQNKHFRKKGQMGKDIKLNRTVGIVRKSQWFQHHGIFSQK